MGTVVLATMGSWGDIFPVVGLAKGLSVAGHEVRIAASPAYSELVQSEALSFAGIIQSGIERGKRRRICRKPCSVGECGNAHARTIRLPAGVRLPSSSKVRQTSSSP